MEVVMILTGTKYPNQDGSSREKNISHCLDGEPLQLRHTPIPQDKNAVRVFRQNGEELGWIPRENAREISGLLDRGINIPAFFQNEYQRYVNAPLSAKIRLIKPQATSPETTKTCGHCGYQIDIKATKCPSCNKSICVNCGNPIGSGVTKCPKCGEATTLGSIQSIGFLLFGIGIFLVFMVLFFVIC